ncbi:MAG: NAD(P)H-dependent oxidoreductase [Rhodobacter sp.]|nr:NAD(P)H-dependent oxidoreductase [Rhodobacter sp.]
MTQHNILGICGSLRSVSVNRKLLAEAIRLYGPAETQIADIRLPLYDGDLETTEGIPQAVNTLAHQIATAEAVIIASPEYNKLIPGVLKNALDWVSRVKGNPWRGKPVALMSAAAGRTGGETGQYTIRHALTPFRPRFSNGPYLMVADGANQFDDAGRLVNERSRATLTELMQTLRAEAEQSRKS